MNFNKWQMLVDVLKFGIACLIAYSGHPYLGIFVAMIQLEVRK